MTLAMGFQAADLELLWGAEAPLSSRRLNIRAFLGLTLMWKKLWGLGRLGSQQVVWLQTTGDELYTPGTGPESSGSVIYAKTELCQEKVVGREPTGQDGGSRGQARGRCWLKATAFQTSLSPAERPS